MIRYVNLYPIRETFKVNYTYSCWKEVAKIEIDSWISSCEPHGQKYTWKILSSKGEVTTRAWGGSTWRFTAEWNSSERSFFPFSLFLHFPPFWKNCSGKITAKTQIFLPRPPGNYKFESLHKCIIKSGL